jgi:hypothetical protein
MNKKKLNKKEKSSIQTNKTIEPILMTSETIDSHSKVKQYWYGKHMDIFSVQYWNEWYKKGFKKRSLLIAVILLNNGKYDMVTVLDDDGHFKYKKQTYVLDISFMREDVHSGLNMLFYYEGLSIPLKISVNMDSVMDTIEGSEFNQIISALNPSTLQAFIKSEVIKQLISSGDLTAEVKSLRTLMYVSLGLSGLAVFFILRMNGVL